MKRHTISVCLLFFTVFFAIKSYATFYQIINFIRNFPYVKKMRFFLKIF